MVPGARREGSLTFSILSSRMGIIYRGSFLPTVRWGFLGFDVFAAASSLSPLTRCCAMSKPLLLTLCVRLKHPRIWK